MFRLSSDPIDGAALRHSMVTPDGGALVVFEGNVRNHNRGRAVLHLDYEGAEDIAAKEFAKLEADARGQFDFLQIQCVHRTGRLLPGETAVWIGVTAVHRSAAFATCQFAINELKKRLPIWKKEFYADGDSGWIASP